MLLKSNRIIVKYVESRLQQDNELAIGAMITGVAVELIPGLRSGMPGSLGHPEHMQYIGKECIHCFFHTAGRTG